MNFNLELFEKTEAKSLDGFESLKLGGHAIKILDAREHLSEFSGNTSLKVCVDIAETDEQKGFFKKQYDANTDDKKKWPNGATKFLSLKDDQLGYLKGFITALEKSNPSFKFNIKGTWDQLKGLKLAGVFGLEEYEKNDSSIGTATKLVQFRSLDKLDTIKIPKVKLLDGSYIEYEKYKPSNENKAMSISEDFEDVIEITDSFLD